VELVVEGNNDEMVVRVTGEILASNCHELRDSVQGLAVRGRVLSVNLAGVTFIDTSGIGVLIMLRTHFKARGGDLRVADPQPQVLRVFKTMGIAPIFGLRT
jgi:anti-anti-sigma factor